MTYYPAFADLLNRELHRQDRTASWLAQRLGISPSTVTRWINHGTRPGTPEVVVKITEILRIPSKTQDLLISAGYGYQSANTALEAMVEPSQALLPIAAPSLPVPPTPLVGRDREVISLVEWLVDPLLRLLTIVGPGGMGKTRLALAVAQQQQEHGRFAHGVTFVSLAPLSDPAQVPAAVAQALGLPLESATDAARAPEQQIFDFVRTRQQLLLLDNLEHLLDCAPLVVSILDSAPGVKILITTRTPLGLPQEQRYPLRGLDYTGQDAVDAWEAIGEHSPAVALFLQAAQRVCPTYDADRTERDAIVEICRLVEGMPLAIELAASWVTVLPAAEIASEIRQSLAFLETNLAGMPDRHRSMETVFDATWQHLNATEQQLFAQLSVFRGEFTRHAAKHVTGAGVGHLRALAAKSLIVYGPEQNRYAIHELLRQYGSLRLEQSGIAQAKRAYEAHSVFYLDLLRRHQEAIKRRGLHAGLVALDVDVENVRKAWHWAAAHGHVTTLVETLDGWGLYLLWRGQAEAGAAACQSAAAALTNTDMLRHHARALAWQALFLRTLGQSQMATERLQRSWQIIETLTVEKEENRSARAFVLMQLGIAAAAQNTEAAQTYYQESLTLFEEGEEPWHAAEVLLGLGHVRLTLGDYDGQRGYVQRALEIYRLLGNARGEAAAMSMLADIDTYQRRPESALTLGQQSLAAFQMLGDPIGIATCLSRIGFAYINMGKVGQARRVVSQSARLFSDLGIQREQVIAQAFLCAIELMAGDYAAAHRFAQHSLEIALALDDQFLQGVALSFFGWTQLYTISPQVALPTLRQAVAVTERIGAASDLARASAVLALAEWKSGLCEDALTHCLQSLRLSSQVADPWGLLTALSAAIAVLADRGQPQRAIELYSRLRNDPLCAASCWFRDSIGASVAAAKAQIPEPMVETALATERPLDQRQTAAQLVDEIQALKYL